MSAGTDAFDFHLPPERIAQHPANPRDSARLLHVADQLRDRIIRDLPALLEPGDLLIVNDTRVIPAQFIARRGAAKIGITLDQPRPDGTWHALARNARRLRPGDRLDAEDPGLSAEIVANEGDGAIRLRFAASPEALRAALDRAASIALPPYIKRPQGPTETDRETYQTIYAAQEGAVAAPTAGLHFTPDLLAALDARGVARATITLHVGAGTFLPVRETDPAQHRMHSERGTLPPATAAAIAATRRAGKRLVAVGTTVLRLLETACDDTGIVHPFEGETDIFIRPGTPIRTADLLLTNFHLPRSTLFMLVCAFAGTERMRAAYAHAVAESYRFYSYGDACLLERK